MMRSLFLLVVVVLVADSDLKTNCLVLIPERVAHSLLVLVLAIDG